MVGTVKGKGHIKNLKEDHNFPNTKAEILGREGFTQAQIMTQIQALMVIW